MDTDSILEEDIAPKKPNIARSSIRKRGRGRPRKNEQAIPKGVTIPAQAKRFDYALNPMRNATELVKYFRSKISIKVPGHVVFDEFKYETRDATEILDILKMHKRDGIFLEAWINGYIGDAIQSKEDALNSQRTSLKRFKSTFEVYNNSYYEHK